MYHCATSSTSYISSSLYSCSINDIWKIILISFYIWSTSAQSLVSNYIIINIMYLFTPFVYGSNACISWFNIGFYTIYYFTKVHLCWVCMQAVQSYYHAYTSDHTWVALQVINIEIYHLVLYHIIFWRTTSSRIVDASSLLSLSHILNHNHMTEADST